MRENRETAILTLSAALPMLISAFFLWLDFLPTFMPAGIRQIVHSYCVVMISFIAGTHWGMQINNTLSSSLMMASCVITLLAWLSLLMPGTVAGFIFILALFLVLWGMDAFQWKQQQILPRPFVLRSIVYVVVIFCLLLIVFD